MNRKIFMKFNVLTAALLVTAVLSASPVAAQDFALGTVVGAPGELWEINLTTLATSFLTDTLLNNAANQPNAQAWDDVNKRFYYAKALGGNLYVWEQATDTHTFLGNLESLSSMTNDGNGATPALASAAFYNGEYYFVVDGTDDLWKVTFSGPLAISAVTFVGDLTGNHHVFFFGDIAINSSGVLYGSGALQVPIVEVQFFSYVLGSSTFNPIKTAQPSTDYTLAQITFNTPTDDTLYAFTTTGVTTADHGEVFTVNLANGDYTPVIGSGGTNLPNPLMRFRDVAGATRPFALAPSIDIHKTVYEGWDAGASAPGGEFVENPVDGMVTYVFTVTNTGDFTLTVDISDLDLMIDIVDLTLLEGTQPLDPGEKLVYYYEATVVENLVNEACATGTATSGDEVSDCDSAAVLVPCVCAPPALASIDISKTPDSQTILTGADAAFTIVVTNTGDVALTNVMVSDPEAPACDRNIGDLAVGASFSYDCTFVMVMDSFTNVATATGTPIDGGNSVSDMDTAGVVVGGLGGQGCTPGYWKQEQHFDSWVVYETYDKFFAVFGVGPDVQLKDVLKTGGGGKAALNRHAVAALLNASNPDVAYAFTPDEVIAMVQEAYATGNFEATKDIFAAENESGCPLN